MRGALARACANVALVKYWGKRDDALNLPATGSISLTLAGLTATARVGAAASPRTPRFVQDGRAVEGLAAERMARFLDLVAGDLGVSERLATEVEATFPVAAGLASSAAIYCAVAAASVAACGARVTREELSAIARRGSGSAARSVFGGLVEWRRGDRPDGADSTAVELLPESGWDIAMAVAIVSEERKPVASRDAMRHVAQTSPLYAGWLAAQHEDLESMRTAIAARDLGRAGSVAEENCLRMHAVCMAARPPILYWTPVTLAVMREVQALRAAGPAAYFTVDAGPQVKALCRGADLARVAERLSALPGVSRVLRARPGPGVEILEGAPPWR